MLQNKEFKLLTTILLFNTLMTILVVATDSIFFMGGGFCYKCIASILFVIFSTGNIFIGKFSLNKKVDKYLILLLTGQIFAAAGDIVLEYNFALGAGIFAIGHVFFFIAFYMLHKFNKMDIIFISIMILIALSVLLFHPDVDYKGMFVVLLVYAIVISTMVGKAISNLVVTKKAYLEIVVLIGALLFFISDMCLLFANFAGGGKVMDFWCLYTYYPSHCFLALSAIIYMIKQEN